MTKLLFLSDYFEVSLDYLMRGTENNERDQTEKVSYTAGNMPMIWNSFVSNLTDRQRKLVTVFYVLLIGVFIAIIVSFLYGAGFAVGQCIAHIEKSLHP